MNKFFEIVNLPVPCVFILSDHTRFDLRTGIPNNAVAVFKTGFKNLGLKPGAEKLFKKETVETIVSLIQKARRIEDVEVLVLAKPESKEIQEAAEAKRKEFK